MNAATHVCGACWVILKESLLIGSYCNDRESEFSFFSGEEVGSMMLKKLCRFVT